MRLGADDEVDRLRTVPHLIQQKRRLGHRRGLNDFLIGRSRNDALALDSKDSKRSRRVRYRVRSARQPLTSQLAIQSSVVSAGCF